MPQKKDFQEKISPAVLQQRIAALGKEISQTFDNKPLTLICVLKGAFIFCADLMREITVEDTTVEFIGISTYKGSTCTQAKPALNLDIKTSVTDRHLLLVEDIVDTGYSMQFLIDTFTARNPLSLYSVALIDKCTRREVDIKVDFAGFRVDDTGFIIGYGMDMAEKYRGLPAVYEIECEP